MADKSKKSMLVTKEQTPAEALDALNMELQKGSNAPVTHRRLMEAGIEAKSRKRRSREGSVSSAIKTKVSK